MGAHGMCRHCLLSKGFLEVVLIFIAISMTLPPKLYAQPGFLSIDCGSTRGNYTDQLGLNWVTDNGTYVKSGTSFSMASFPSDVDVGNITSSFRYFPQGRKKYCYELPTTPNAKYLVRLSFYMHASVLNQFKPFQFSVSINATYWFSLSSGGEDSGAGLDISGEGIFYSPESVMHLCLQPIVGLAFISSVELRQLDPSMYQYGGSTVQFLFLGGRYNVGANYTDSNVRYPDDEYDRIWLSPDQTFYIALPIITQRTAPDQTTGPEVYYVPPKVMRDGWLFAYPTNKLSATLNWDAPQASITQGAYLTFVLYSEHLNASDSQIYGMNYTLDGPQNQPWNFSNKASMVTVANYILSSSQFHLTISLADGARLANGPTLNALELYAQYNFNFSTTTQDDDNAITAMKASFNLTDWQGDPCTPVPHDWLACSLDSPAFQPISHSCFSDGTGVIQCPGQEGYFRSNYYVINVSLSDLPTNGFDILKTSPRVFLGSLSNMSITRSGVDGQTFDFLVNKFSNSTVLTVLDFSNNSIDRVPNWKHASKLVDLDLSHNNLIELTSTQDLPLPGTLQNLNLSYNAITYIPSAWQTAPNKLVVLDLSHNKLHCEISSLDGMMQLNSGSLQELYVHDNNFYGTFNGSVYFTKLSNLTIANFSQNAIQGTLDLSTWYDTLESAASESVKAVAAAPQSQLYSFVNNNISNIVPNVKSIDATMQKILESQQYGAILLGGNPYCNGASVYIQKYLCRSTLNEIISRDHHKKSKAVLIASICGGVIALLLICVIFATLWHLWKQVFALRKVQQALADRKVQPPFFHYTDLKSATRDFNNENKLGRGGFGVVYKGVLVDGTMIAVKKLFNLQGLEVLEEFLNEVVLITGIKHRNLVQLKGCCIKDKQRMLVFECVEKGNLAEALWGSKVHGGLNWEQRFDICVGVARGLAYLHEELQPSVIHRDIKPANILLDKNFKPKIADFGLARHSSDETNQSQYTQIAGTLGYFSPEYALLGQLSNKADVYSYGIVVLEIVSGRKCIDSSLPDEQKFLKNWACALIKKGLVLNVLEIELRDHCVPAEVIRVINIALLCVQYYPERRPSMSEVVTLLSRKINVQSLMGESENIQSNFEDLISSINGDTEYSPALQRLADDSTVHPALSSDSLESTSEDYTGTRNQAKGPLIELNAMYAR